MGTREKKLIKSLRQVKIVVHKKNCKTAPRIKKFMKKWKREKIVTL